MNSTLRRMFVIPLWLAPALLLAINGWFNVVHWQIHRHAVHGKDFAHFSIRPSPQNSGGGYSPLVWSPSQWNAVERDTGRILDSFPMREDSDAGYSYVPFPFSRPTSLPRLVDLDGDQDPEILIGEAFLGEADPVVLHWDATARGFRRIPLKDLSFSTDLYAHEVWDFPLGPVTWIAVLSVPALLLYYLSCGIAFWFARRRRASQAPHS